ncbi:MAG: hypothetical protein DF221_00450 [Brevibacillus sp.]|nr:MAG: hypothetical protein DF221_00450 [Brevibacillus sp.]
MLNKLLSAFLTAFLFCVLLAYTVYTPIDERDETVYYFSFSSLVIIYLVYALPITFLAGIPLSLLIDFIDKKIVTDSKIKRYIVNLGLYSLAGVTVALFFLIISGDVLNKLFDFIRYSFVFIFPSLLFYHISIFIRFITKGFRQCYEP